MAQVKKITTLMLLMLAFSLSGWAQIPEAPSAVRLPHEDYTTKILQFISIKESDEPSDNQYGANDTIDRRSVMNSAVALNETDVQAIQEWPSDQDFSKYFTEIRDERFMETESEFPRRSTWLYPDDGCYARAAISNSRSEAMGLPAPSRVFVFGNLNVKTANSLWGSVTWWYHVAVSYRIQDVVYIIDPSVDPLKPLPLEEWLNFMGDSSQMQVAFCSAGAYSPNSSCLNAEPLSYEQSLQAQKPFLRYEWKRLQDLGRDPESELGDNPPWGRTIH
ncbi:protein-glutamine glutaminase family protein [Pseudobdellovibrio exovorus]|uniref:Protein glutaminase domain-containing protein n=1 Tax=Pseudobdellovibrio exovorus JSS TaxID=1184267 RepID=M4V794_9BACT|nr:protein-glutamine glutaminase family protein [Pseudobdellovibrio exovorus]AGH95267.1 hypothetical protein A11Q_1051 [Pseudobdellovibrio exovorus JSS]